VIPSGHRDAAAVVRVGERPAWGVRRIRPNGRRGAPKGYWRTWSRARGRVADDCRPARAGHLTTDRCLEYPCLNYGRDPAPEKVEQLGTAR
jgi:hypothetical protein